MKKISLFALLVLFNFVVFSQNANEILLLTKPHSSRGFLVWSKAPSGMYRIKINQKIPDGNGGVENKLILSQTLRDNFYHFGSNYLNDDSYTYQVQVLNPLGQILYETEEILACGDCGSPYITYSWWTCLSQLYAYRIFMELPEYTLGLGFLRVDNAYHLTSPDTFGGSMETPYYEAMSPTVFNARMNIYNFYYEGVYSPSTFNPSYPPNIYWYQRTNVQASENIIDANNNVLTGHVYFVGKRMMQFTPNQLYYSNPCVYEPDASNETQWAVNLYNLATPDAPVDLSCSEYGFSGGPNAEDGQDDLEGPDWDEETTWDSEWIDDCFGTVFQSNMLYSIMHITVVPCDGGFSAPNHLTAYANAIENIVSIQISSMTNANYPVVNLNPINVIPRAGVPFVSHNTQFETGVYILRFFFGDGSNYTTIVSHDAQNQPVINNASFATLTVVPNPVTDSWLKLELAVERYMKFDLEVLTLNGTVIYTESMSMQEDTHASKRIRLPSINFPSNQLIVRMKFQDGSILQQTALINN